MEYASLVIWRYSSRLLKYNYDDGAWLAGDNTTPLLFFVAVKDKIKEHVVAEL